MFQKITNNNSRCNSVNSFSLAKLYSLDLTVSCLFKKKSGKREVTAAAVEYIYDLKDVTETASEEFENSYQFTLHLKNMILDAQEEGGKTKLTIKAERRQKQQAKLERLREEIRVLKSA